MRIDKHAKREMLQLLENIHLELDLIDDGLGFSSFDEFGADEPDPGGIAGNSSRIRAAVNELRRRLCDR